VYCVPSAEGGGGRRKDSIGQYRVERRTANGVVCTRVAWSLLLSRLEKRKAAFSPVVAVEAAAAAEPAAAAALKVKPLCFLLRAGSPLHCGSLLHLSCGVFLRIHIYKKSVGKSRFAVISNSNRALGRSLDPPSQVRDRSGACQPHAVG
jgi:hypothetical protein